MGEEYKGIVDALNKEIERSEITIRIMDYAKASLANSPDLITVLRKIADYMNLSDLETEDKAELADYFNHVIAEKMEG